MGHELVLVGSVASMDAYYDRYATYALEGRWIWSPQTNAGHHGKQEYDDHFSERELLAPLDDVLAYYCDEVKRL